MCCLQLQGDQVHLDTEVIRRKWVDYIYIGKFHGMWPVRATEREEVPSFTEPVGIEIAK
jgi:hypothetical protein